MPTHDDIGPSATDPVQRSRVVRAAARFLGENAAIASESPAVEQQWMITRAGLLWFASSLSAVGYFLFLGTAFSEISYPARCGVTIALWLFIIFLDRAVSSIRHGGSGSTKTAALIVRLIISIMLTTATSLAFTIFFAGAELNDRIDARYRQQIAPLVEQRDEAYRKLDKQMTLLQDGFVAAEKRLASAAVLTDSVQEQIAAQQRIADTAATDMRNELPTGKGAKYHDALQRRDNALRKIGELKQSPTGQASTEGARRSELDGLRDSLERAQKNIADEKNEVDRKMRRDPNYFENRHDPLMIVSTLLALLSDPVVGEAARRILAIFGAVILVLEMSFVVLSTIAPSGEYDRRVRYARPRSEPANEGKRRDLSPEESNVIIYAPGWQQRDAVGSKPERSRSQG